MTIRKLNIHFEGHEIAVLAGNENIDEPAVIFIPGVLAPVNFWLACLPESILNNRRWYSISLPGHHPSKVADDYKPEDVNEEWFNRLYQSVIVQLVADRKVIVVGHSTGGFTALNLAANKFDSLLGVVSVAGFFKGNWGGIEGQLIRLAGLGKWAKPLFQVFLAASRSIPIVQEYMASLLTFDRKAYNDSPITKKMLNEIQGNMQGQKLANLFPLFNRVGQFNIFSKLEAIQVPVTVMAGSHDPVINALQSLRLAGAINESNLVVFDLAGHMPFMERTDQFNNELCSAIDTYLKLNTTQGI
jgi:pimeloyl-ACP methyl ester carboxylesterase